MKDNILVCLPKISPSTYLFSNDAITRLLAGLIYGFNYILITSFCLIVLYLSGNCELVHQRGIDFTSHLKNNSGFLHYLQWNVFGSRWPVK